MPRIHGKDGKFTGDRRLTKSDLADIILDINELDEVTDRQSFDIACFKDDLGDTDEYLFECMQKIRRLRLFLLISLAYIFILSVIMAAVVYSYGEAITMLSKRTVELAGRDIGLVRDIETLSDDIYPLIESHIEAEDIEGRE